MSEYTTTAIISEVKKDGKIYLKGCSKFIYEKDAQTKWLILEGNSACDSKFLEETTDFVVDMSDEILKIIIASAMINKKAMKLTVKKDTNDTGDTYSIVSIKNP